MLALLKMMLCTCQLFWLSLNFSNSLFIVYMILLHQGQMIMQDKLEKERVDAKNNVEEYVYEMRNKLSADLAQFMKEEVTKFVLFK